MTEKERLELEIKTLEAAMWLIKDRTTPSECYFELDRAKKARTKRLEKLPSED